MVGIPCWPDPASPGKDFVRAFGSVQIRSRGGLTGWVGENIICDSRNAIRFAPSAFQSLERLGDEFYLECKIAFRRLHFDGVATGKIEVGLIISGTSEVTSHLIASIVRSVLMLNASITQIGCDSVSSQLANAGSPLAALYLRASLKQPYSEIDVKSWWVKSGSPMVLVALTPRESLDLTKRSLVNNRIDKLYGTVNYINLRLAQRHIPVWIVPSGSWLYSPFHSTSLCGYSDCRKLRLWLTRLHAERECLRSILENISANGRIAPEYGSCEWTSLMRYLNNSTKRIGKAIKGSSKYRMSKSAELASTYINKFDPDAIDSITRTLEAIKMSKNISNKVINHVSNQRENIYNMIEQQYNFGNNANVGAIVSGSAKLSECSFKQWQGVS